MSNYARIKAIEKKNKEKLLKVNPQLTEESGIYFLTRVDEDDFKYAYIGQAKQILTRLAQHLTGYQHIDLSLRKHGLYTEDNQYGWEVGFLKYPVNELDDKEQYWIKQYANKGYQLRNKTSGSQGVGKKKIDDFNEPKGYRDGLKQGRKNCSREIAHLFEKHLNVTTKKENPTVNQKKALEKFNDFLSYYKEE